MNVDGNAGVRRVIAAFPAARTVLERMGIDVNTNESLHRACEKAGVRIEDVQQALANIDWTRDDDSSG